MYIVTCLTMQMLLFVSYSEELTFCELNSILQFAAHSSRVCKSLCSLGSPLVNEQCCRVKYHQHIA